MLFLAKIGKFLLKCVVWFLITSIVSVILFRFMPVPITPLMLIRCIEQKSDDKDMRLKHDWVSLEEINERLQLAVVCSEDQNYLRHDGFDWGAIKKAMKQNKKGKRIRGGSTITQQTAKNVFLWPGRSYIRKGFEAYFTFLIELFWSKERIMEVYLNSIEMGDGIYGAEAAAQHWFKKSAIKLNKDQAAAIAAVLPNPRKYVANPAGPYIQNRKAWIKKQMDFWGNDLDYDKIEEEN
ncbi:MAG: monofunctional biosynthetic peptidoglycan transglycosylase [Sphingobacteriaceae bacterium]|nr:monofunctional biosynthetic peptidoglycan transglycosylase [Sphingobacteriaceae bacterium]MBK7817606.1 monofunctional biosynthetic peptidoglycan transglycosylase [Sphingobacteriaceae bacterium]